MRLSVRLIQALFLTLLILSPVASRAAIQPLSPPSVALDLPLPAANAFGVSAAFGPTDGLLYVWNGAQVLKQNTVDTPSFTSIGNVGSGSADAGPIRFSVDGTRLLVGNGYGGVLGGAHSGQVFSIPASGGNSNTAVGNLPFHETFLAAPLGGSNGKFFVNQGEATFTSSSVSVFDADSGTNVSVISNIPGASGSMAINAQGRLFVGVGFGPERGTLRSFALSEVENAYLSGTPLNWTSGQVFNAADNNGGAGMFFDARGFLFVGGPQGITVFDKQGNSEFYDNNGYTSVVYDPLGDRVLALGFGNEQGIYPAASFFPVPEPSSVALAAMGMLVFLPLVRRRVRRRSLRG